MIDKKEIKRKYKDSKQAMGVYQIRNLVNGKIYLASTSNMHAIFNSSRFKLANGLHVNKELQRDYAQFGEEKFAFEILDYLEPKEDADHDYTKELQVLEAMWLEKIQPYGEKGYNRNPC